VAGLPPPPGNSKTTGGAVNVPGEGPSASKCWSRPVRQSPHAADGVYIVLEGSGVLKVEGKRVDMRERHAELVVSSAEHRFVPYEWLSVLVIFERQLQRGAAGTP
jgi:mannose-6-phosphate isomerase-like protein (cupin superfamily)